jgi:hypothetical protein
MTGPTPLYCATHPEVETQLRCGKCGKPICPRCLVQTPVGSRCRECAKLYKLPTYRVPPIYYLRAAGAALGLAVVLGLAWGLVSAYIPIIYINLLIAAGIGWLIGEVAGLAVNRKRGFWLAVIGGAAVAVCYVVNISTFGSFPGLEFGLAVDIAGVVIGIVMAVSRLK